MPSPLPPIMPYVFAVHPLMTRTTAPRAVTVGDDQELRPAPGTADLHNGRMPAARAGGRQPGTQPLWMDDLRHFSSQMARAFGGMVDRLVTMTFEPHRPPLQPLRPQEVMVPVLGVFAGFMPPTTMAVARARSRRAEQQVLGGQKKWPPFDALPSLDVSACGKEPVCGICWEPVSALTQPVAACHQGVIQVFELAMLETYWQQFPARGATTPNYMPIDVLYKITVAACEARPQ